MNADIETSADLYACTKCGRGTSGYFERCAVCLAFNSCAAKQSAAYAVYASASANTAKHGQESATAAVPVSIAAPRARSLADYRASDTPRLSTGSREFDRVLGGTPTSGFGFVPGCVVLLGGQPGSGKSSAVGAMLSHVVSNGLGTAFYATGEESFEQAALRHARLGAQSPRIHLLATSDVDEAIAEASATPRVAMVVDSIQTMRCANAKGSAGSIAQVKTCIERLTAYAKGTRTPVILVCHVTKDGELAGPKTLEHLVDVVLELEVAPDGMRRLLTSPKNRHGSTAEIGVLEMTARGLVDAEDPGAALALERAAGRPGSAVACVAAGSRVGLVEVQALLSPARGESGGKLNAVGIDAKRASMLLAILAEHADIDALASDVFLGVAGGVQLRDPASDAAVALAIASSARRTPVQIDTIAIGELGLAGELRAAPGLRQRLAEVKRAGLSRVIVGTSAQIQADAPSGIVVMRAANVEEMIAMSGIARDESSDATPPC